MIAVERIQPRKTLFSCQTVEIWDSLPAEANKILNSSPVIHPKSFALSKVFVQEEPPICF